MQTSIIQQYLDTPKGQEADRILRSCVHCGFCTATCPTYQLLGDELDSPRGRIYLIKQVLEGKPTGNNTQQHLDRCLTCRSCETTCPSGVQYGRLVDIGRELVEQQQSRNLTDRVMRLALRNVIPYPARFAFLLRLGQFFRPFMPYAVTKKIPDFPMPQPWPEVQHQRRMLVLQGCAQSVATPATNSATARVLDKLGIELITTNDTGCCGAVSHHLSATDEALNFMRRNIDAWWPYVEQGVEAIVITASGCGVMVKEYGHLLSHDQAYAEKASKISTISKDISEVLRDEDLSSITIKQGKRVAFHSPCTLQHGMQLNGVVESILERVGLNLTRVSDPHICCGSAGTYSILQADLSQQLLANKLNALQQDKPEVIATANIGCQMHLSTGAGIPVRHWIELLAEGLD